MEIIHGGFSQILGIIIVILIITFLSLLSVLSDYFSCLADLKEEKSQLIIEKHNNLILEKELRLEKNKNFSLEKELKIEIKINKNLTQSLFNINNEEREKTVIHKDMDTKLDSLLNMLA